MPAKNLCEDPSHIKAIKSESSTIVDKAQKANQLKLSCATPAELQKYSKVKAELEADFYWYQGFVSKIAPKGSLEKKILDASFHEEKRMKPMVREVQGQVVADILHGIQSKFQGQGQDRPLRLFSLLTLRGEFRAKGDEDNHRTLGNLNWVMIDIQNRPKAHPKVKSRFNYLLSVRDEFDLFPSARAQNILRIKPNRSATDWLRGTSGGAILAPQQFSAWNLGHGALSDIILSEGFTYDLFLMKDLIDFMAAFEAGLVVIDPHSPAKKTKNINQYLSPLAMKREMIFDLQLNDLLQLETLTPSEKQELKTVDSQMRLARGNKRDELYRARNKIARIGINRNPKNEREANSVNRLAMIALKDSPYAPEHWKNMDEIFKGKDAFPKVMRKDQIGTGKNGLLSTKPGEDEGWINGFHFEGAYEKW